jgi:hypothetical protein
MDRNNLIMIFLFGANVLLVQAVRSQSSTPGSSPTISLFPASPSPFEATVFAKPKVSELLTQTLTPTQIIAVGSESGYDTFCFVLDNAVRYVNKVADIVSDQFPVEPLPRLR